MTNSDDELYDLDVDSLDFLDEEEDYDGDFQDDHDSEITDNSPVEDLQEQLPKKRSLLAPFLVIVIFSFAGYLLYSFLNDAQSLISVPVVKISASEQVREPARNEEDTSAPEPEIVPVVQDDSVGFAAPVAPEPETAFVLTPLPDSFDSADLFLDVTGKADDELLQNSDPLHEDELLLKTEASFEEEERAPPPPLEEEIEVPALVAVPPPAHEENVAAQEQPAGTVDSDLVYPKMKPAVPKKIKVQWIIKAVLPEKAVIHDPNTGETRFVEVGDVVPPIGRIASIEKPSTRWVITGADGIIEQ